MSRTKVKRAAAHRVASAPAVAGFRPSAAALAVAAAMGMQPVVAPAQPTGGQVIHGQASFLSQGNNLVVRTQNGAGNFSAINWQSFSIPAGSVTRFVQPSKDSTSINRVVGNDPSAIFGTLRSNGKLVLVNQSGIAVGAGAVVDTAGFTASTLGMSDEDAASGRLRFTGADGAGALTVDGSIVARSGDVVLIAPSVRTGEQALVQSNGSTMLAAGRKVEITGRGLEGIHLEVQAGDKAVNLGTLRGDAVGIFAHTLKHSGLVRAQAVTEEGGKVVLKATRGDALVSGAITASKGGHGGSVDVLGERVGLLAGTAIDVSGAQGGGQVRIGGDYQGRNAGVPNAQATYVDAAATIRADATEQGDGGRVIVWADESTRMHGNISARGGGQGGDGGFAEVSGKQFLEFAGRADLRAPKGEAGTLLLDPTDIVISGNGGTQTSIGPIFSGGGDTSNIRDTTLAAQLELGNVQVTTQNVESNGADGGSITLKGNAEVAWGSGTTLGLFADTLIQLDGKITAIAAPPPPPALTAAAVPGTTNGALHLQAGTYIQQDATTSVLQVADVHAQSSGGGISLTGANAMNRFQGVASGPGNNISVVNAGPLTLGQVSTVYGGGGTNAIGTSDGVNAGNADITTTSGDLRVDPGANIDVGGNARLQAAGNVAIDDASVHAMGTLQVAAGLDVRIGARSNVGETSTHVTGGAGLSISAGRDVVVGNDNHVEVGSSTSLQSSGDIEVVGTRDIRFRSSSNSVLGNGSNGVTRFGTGGDMSFGSATLVHRSNGSIDVAAGGSILGSGVFQTNGRGTGGTDVGRIRLNAEGGSLSFLEVRSHGSFSGDSAGDIQLVAQGDIAGGNILAHGMDNFGSSVAGDGGTVTVTARGRIDLGGVQANGGSVLAGSAAGGTAGAGGKIMLSAGMGVQAGNLSATGGSAQSDTVTGGGAGDGGGIEVTSTSGDLVLASLNAHGGSSSGPTGAGAGGVGGDIMLTAGGNVSGYEVDVSGGTGAPAKAAGGIQVNAGGSVAFESLHANGGFGADGTDGGRGGLVSVTAQGDITLRSYGGPAASVDGGGSYLGRGGDAGFIVLKSTGGSIVAEQAPASVASVAAIEGPAPGFSANGGYGWAAGDGGGVTLEAKAGIRTDGVQALGGEAQAPGAAGGSGGIASVTFGGTLAAPFIAASGGKGGDASGTVAGGEGGGGGTVQVVRAGVDLVLGSDVQLAARGGNGGNGETEGAPLVGNGGAGGLVDVSSTAGEVVLQSPEIHSQGGMGGVNFDGSSGGTGTRGVFTAAGSQVQVQGAMQLHSTWVNTSDVRMNTGSSVTGGGSFVNFGSVRLAGSSALMPSSGVTNAEGARIGSFGGNTSVHLVHNHGLVEVAPGATLDTPDFSFNDGKVVVDGTLNLGAGVPGGPAALGTGFFTNAATGDIGGSGKLVVAGGAGTVASFGTISPGGAGTVGTLTLSGNLVMESGSTLALDFAGGTSFDKLLVGGNARTGGGVAVNVLGAAEIPAGSYAVMQASTLDAATLPTVSPAPFEPVASGSDLRLVVAAPPPPPPPPPAVQNEVEIFAQLFVREATRQEDKARGKDDIVITDTACKP